MEVSVLKGQSGGRRRNNALFLLAGRKPVTVPQCGAAIAAHARRLMHRRDLRQTSALLR